MKFLVRLAAFSALLCLVRCPSYAQQGALMPPVHPTFFGPSGTVAANGFICTTVTGTTTSQVTYQDSGLTTANQNPIRLNGLGRAVNGSNEVSIFLQAKQYRITLYGPGSGNVCNGTTVGFLINQADNVYDLSSITAASNKVCQTFSQAGTSFDARISACISALPGTGGTIDALGESGTQNYAACPWTGVTKPIYFRSNIATSTLNVSCTVPANVTYEMMNGSILSPNLSTTLTINGPIAADVSQHFAGSGTILIGNLVPTIAAEWFPNSGAAQINAANAARGSTQGLVSVGSSVTTGSATTLASTLTLMDLRASKTIIGNNSGYNANVLMDSSNGTGTTNRVFGFAAQIVATSGGTGVANQGETVAFFAAAERTGSGTPTAGRPIWAMNSVTVVDSGQRTNQSIGYELDFNNNDTDVAITANAVDQQIGLTILSGGTHKPLTGLIVNASSSVGAWQIGEQISNWNTTGLKITGPILSSGSTANLYLIPQANDTNLSIVGRNAADSTTIWSINNDGSAAFGTGSLNWTAGGALNLAGALTINNNINVNLKDTGGTARPVLFQGADNTTHLRGGTANGIIFETNTPTTQMTLNSSGITLPNNIDLNLTDTGATARAVLFLGGDNTTHFRAGTTNGTQFENSAAVSQFLINTGVFLTAATQTAAASTIGLGNTTTANTNCGTLAGSAGCLQINVGGTNRFIPFY